MSSFKKLQLLSEEEVNRLKQKQISQYDPQLRAAAFLQTEIDDLLGNKDMDSQQKMTLFQMAQQRFASLLGKNEMSKVPLAGIRTQLAEEEQEQPRQQQPQQPVFQFGAPPADEVDDVEVENIIGTVPPSQKKQAKALMEFLEKRKAELGYDDLGQLVIKGQPLQGSNFQDMILSLYTSRKDFHTPGLDVFLNILRKLNVPRGIIKNTALLSAKSTFSKTGPHEEDDPLEIYFDAPDTSSSSKRKRAGHPPGYTPNVLSLYGPSKSK